jgi:hypothetical protein
LPPHSVVITFHLVHTWEGLGIDLHGGLAQDQSALLNIRLDLSTEFLAIACVVGERVMPLTI